MNISEQRILRPDGKIIEGQQGGFEKRIVSYEALHFIRTQDFDKLVEVIDPREGDVILDAGAGYGAVTREVLSRHLNRNVKFHLLDISDVQLKRATKHLSEMFGELAMQSMSFELDTMVDPHCTSGYFDKIVAKMVIHEIKRPHQPIAFHEMYRILKPGGKFVIWDVVTDQETQYFIRELLRKKDQLADFTYLAENRYFPTANGWFSLFTRAGFQHVKKDADIPYIFETEKRLETEFGGDQFKLSEWHSFIRALAEVTPSEILKRLNYQDHGSNISVRLSKAIYSSVKPS